MLKSSFREHQIYYLWGKALDQLKRYGEAIPKYELSMKIMEEDERVTVDYSDVKLNLVKMRLAFSLVCHSANLADKSQYFSNMNAALKILNALSEETDEKMPKKF